MIEPNSITYFLNTAASELDFFWEGVEFLTFHWQDTMDYVVFDEHGIVVEQIVSFIDEGIRKGQSVLVYSTRGLSRSIVCVAAYMMAKYGWGVDKVFEFLDSKRVPMEPNPSFMNQLADLDWRLQKKRLHIALSLPSERRQLVLEINRVKLLTWQVGAFLQNPADTDDLSADELMLVNSFNNSQSMYTHTHENLPPPAQQEPAHAATAIKWIDEGDDGHFDESTQPIKDTNEAPVYYEQDAKPDYAENLARFDAMMAADNDETRSL